MKIKILKFISEVGRSVLLSALALYRLSLSLSLVLRKRNLTRCYSKLDYSNLALSAFFVCQKQTFAAVLSSEGFYFLKNLRI